MQLLKTQHFESKITAKLSLYRYMPFHKKVYKYEKALKTASYVIGDNCYN